MTDQRPYDWEDDAKRSWELAVACQREQYLVDTIPGVKRARVIGDQTLYLGDCLEVMRAMPANSADSIVTDPPYGLSFMGKAWDKGVPGVEVWREALRVLKPGGHLLAFAGTRTQHRMATAIEDAGFEIRDCIMWHYGQGFPKSKNLGNGFGSALKPATEPITMARKPFKGSLEANYEKHGTGALNVDGCRVVTDELAGKVYNNTGDALTWGGTYGKGVAHGNTQGRWPANLILSYPEDEYDADGNLLPNPGKDEVVGLFPVTTSGGGNKSRKGTTEHTEVFGTYNAPPPDVRDIDTGSAARFFYCAKASKRDRDEGLDHVEAVFRPNGNKWTDQDYRVARGERPHNAESGPRKNVHPTVKPTDLMRYLCRLVTPPGGVVLDPFMGSGSTGKACALEGFAFIGIDVDPNYVEIARARIGAAQREADKPTQEGFDL